jgi:hypothetical protein
MEEEEGEEGARGKKHWENDHEGKEEEEKQGRGGTFIAAAHETQTQLEQIITRDKSGGGSRISSLKKFDSRNHTHAADQHEEKEYT